MEASVSRQCLHLLFGICYFLFVIFSPCRDGVADRVKQHQHRSRAKQRV